MSVNKLILNPLDRRKFMQCLSVFEETSIVELNGTFSALFPSLNSRVVVVKYETATV